MTIFECPDERTMRGQSPEFDRPRMYERHNVRFDNLHDDCGNSSNESITIMMTTGATFQPTEEEEKKSSSQTGTNNLEYKSKT